MASSDDLKSSAHVWGGNGNNETTQSARRANPPPSDLPPSYTNAVEAVSTSQPPLDPLQELALLSSIDFSKYAISQATTSDDRVATTSSLQHLYTKPDILAHLIKDQAALPPKPVMHIKGTHTDDHMRAVVDFDLHFNLTTMLELEQSVGSSRLRVKAAVEDPPAQGSRLFRGSSKRSSASLSPLQIWAKRFCEDKAENKSFTLTRQILDLPTAILEGHIRTLLAQLHYRGKVVISFPVHYTTLTIHKEPANWFVSMLRLYPIKKYEVVESLWDIRGDGDSGKLAQEWWGEWKEVLKNSVLRKQQGRVSVEDWIEAKMGLREKEKAREWGVDGESAWLTG